MGSGGFRGRWFRIWNRFFEKQNEFLKNASIFEKKGSRGFRGCWIWILHWFFGNKNQESSFFKGSYVKCSSKVQKEKFQVIRNVESKNVYFTCVMCVKTKPHFVGRSGRYFTWIVFSPNTVSKPNFIKIGQELGILVI